MKIRSYITASPGNILIQVDLSQAESWIVAFSAEEYNMKQSLQFSDIHRDTASVFYNKPASEVSKLERYTAKKSNHAFAYRMSAQRFQQVFNKDAAENGVSEMSLTLANYLRTKWLERYNLKVWWDFIEAELGRTRILVTPYGRSRMFFDSWGQELFKKATAHIPQSTIADHLNGAVQDELGIEGGLLYVWRDWVKSERCLIVNQSHDSFIADIHPSLKDDYIESCLKYVRRPLVIKGETFTIPVSVEIGERWGMLEEIKL